MWQWPLAELGVRDRLMVGRVPGAPLNPEHAQPKEKEALMVTTSEYQEHVEVCADLISDAYEQWPVGHPSHALVLGYLARELGEEFVTDHTISDAEVSEIVRAAWATAGHDGPHVDLVLGLITTDPNLRPTTRAAA